MLSPPHPFPLLSGVSVGGCGLGLTTDDAVPSGLVGGGVGVAAPVVPVRTSLWRSDNEVHRDGVFRDHAATDGPEPQLVRPSGVRSNPTQVAEAAHAVRIVWVERGLDHVAKVAVCAVKIDLRGRISNANRPESGRDESATSKDKS